METARGAVCSALRPRAAGGAMVARGRRCAVIGVSGADGAGKSTLVRGLRERLESQGAVVRTAYVYGCVVCRRMPPAVGETVERASRSARSPLRRALAGWLRDVHGLVDVAEAWFRLELASRGPTRGLARDRRQSLVLLTDRSPLDSIAKHGAAATPLLAAAFRCLVARYDVILWLSAPGPLLAERDGEHGATHLQAVSARFEAAAERLDNVVELDTAGTSADVLSAADAALEGICARAPGCGP